MGDITKGIEAGFVATIVVSIFMLVQQSTGYLPQLDIIAMWEQASGMPDATLAWILHFIMGVGLWGTGFAVASPHLPGPHWLRGVMFGVFTWFAMMIVFLPSAGMPMFGAGEGPLVPVGTLVLNLVFGVVLGETYHLLLHYLPSEVDENA